MALTSQKSLHETRNDQLFAAELEETKKEFEKYLETYPFPDDLTKSGKKKLTKKLRFDYFKKIYRKMEREKRKLKRTAKPPSTMGEGGPPRKRTKLCESSCKLRVAVDCSFDDLMTERDVSKLTKQVQRCYTLNRNLEQPLQLHITHLQDKTYRRLENIIQGYKNWDVHRHYNPLTDVFPTSQIVYLCAESDNVLEELRDDRVYVIGGFVDHNSHKGLAYQRAMEAGFGHARLPIDEFFTISTRKVLTVCHVFEIITHFSTGCSWSEAIRKTVPERKGLREKESDTEESEVVNADNLTGCEGVDINKEDTIASEEARSEEGLIEGSDDGAKKEACS